MYYFSICMLAFFAVIGMCHLCRGIAQVVSRPRDEREIILIEPIQYGQQNAEFVLRRAAQKVMWYGRNAPDRVICLDCNMDSDTRRMCRLVCSEYPFMEIYTKDEMHRHIDSLA